MIVRKLAYNNSQIYYSTCKLGLQETRIPRVNDFQELFLYEIISVIPAGDD